MTEHEVIKQREHIAREHLRDEFAAAALTGLLASEATDLTWSEFPFDEVPQFVRLAYAFADAALAHRDANPLPLGESPKAPQ